MASRLILFQELPDSAVEVVTRALEGVEMLVCAAFDYRIVNTPMQSSGWSRKDGTALIRVIANRDDVIEWRIKKLGQRL